MIVRVLAKGTNIEAENKHGRTALHVAAIKGSTGAVSLLLASGANIEKQGHEGTALQAALANGHFPVASMLVAHGAEATSLGRWRYTLRQRLTRRTGK